MKLSSVAASTYGQQITTLTDWRFSLNAVIFGQPCSGKSTICKSIASQAKVVYISVGEITSREALTASHCGQAIRANRQSKEPYPERFLYTLMRPHIIAAVARGFILDGYPKHLNELEEVSEILNDVSVPLSHLILVETPADICVERMRQRIICRSCHASFSKESLSDLMCPSCNSNDALHIRSEDNEQDFIRRSNNYFTWTLPLVQEIIRLYNPEVIAVDGRDKVLPGNTIFAADGA